MFNASTITAPQTTNTFPRHISIQRLPDVIAKSGQSRSTIYARIDQKLWTHPVPLGPRMVGWPSYEVDALIFARIAGKSDDEIRALVLELEAARKTCGVKEEA